MIRSNNVSAYISILAAVLTSWSHQLRQQARLTEIRQYPVSLLRHIATALHQCVINMIQWSYCLKNFTAGVMQIYFSVNLFYSTTNNISTLLRERQLRSIPAQMVFHNFRSGEGGNRDKASSRDRAWTRMWVKILAQSHSFRGNILTSNTPLVNARRLYLKGRLG